MAALLGVVLIASFMLGLLYWSTDSADQLSRNRQETLVANVLASSAATIAHDQESVTVWDDPLLQFGTVPLDLDWLDNNVGIWLHDYYGHDAAYVLNPSNRPIYAMMGGERRAPANFEQVARPVLPLVRELRNRMSQGEAADLPDNWLSAGVTDILQVTGRPAIVSVKPHISDSGTIRQTPGEEFVHISLRYLDGSFLTEVRKQYGFAGARFSATADLAGGESAQALRSRSGTTIGYFVWKPFAPGASVFDSTAPILMGVFAIIGFVAFVLVRRIVVRTFELAESNDAVRHLAFHDALTGIPNRALFEDRLEHALAVYRGTAERRVALLYLDLDRFKAVNDTLGHGAGDQLICEFAARICERVKPGDTVARLGGDEFAIIVTDLSSGRDIEDLCEDIIRAASQPFAVGDSLVHVGASVGVALGGKDGLEAAELTRKADIALYEAKSAGRGQYRLFTPAMDEPIRARQNAERDLRKALESKHGLSVAYQPTFSADSGEIVGVEALVRWQHPESGSVAPAIFIPIAEDSGLIEPLGEWVFRQACCDARNWPVDTVSINVSPVQLRRPHFAIRVIAIVSESGIDPSRIELEITETAVLEDTPQCATNLRMLREFGLRVALDDFGTGYSSFSHFNDFQVDRVKIDRTFVDKINSQEGGSAIIQAIIDLARSSGFRTTAEGVETEEQRHFLTRIGCDDLQGFLLARPVAAGEIDALLGVVPDAESEDPVSQDTQAHVLRAVK